MIPSPVEEHLLKKRLVFLCIVMAAKSSGLFPSCTRQQVEPKSLLLACSLRVKVPFVFRFFFQKALRKVALMNLILHSQMGGKGMSCCYCLIYPKSP